MGDAIVQGGDESIMTGVIQCFAKRLPKKSPPFLLKKWNGVAGFRLVKHLDRLSANLNLHHGFSFGLFELGISSLESCCGISFFLRVRRLLQQLESVV